MPEGFQFKGVEELRANLREISRAPFLQREVAIQLFQEGQGTRGWDLLIQVRRTTRDHRRPRRRLRDPDPLLYQLKHVAPLQPRVLVGDGLLDLSE